MCNRFIATALVFFASAGSFSQEDIGPDWLKDNSCSERTKLIVVKPSGHWVMLDQPDLFNRNLAKFLDKLNIGGV